MSYDPEATIAARGSDGVRPPYPLPDPPAIPEPRDTPWPGTIRLEVDATDVHRRILAVREIMPVAGLGELYLLFPKWLPGFHAPQAPIELFAGLVVTARGEPLTWRRHPTTVNAFLIEVPADVATIEAQFQFLSPTDPSQGRVLCSGAMLCLPWNTVLLYPAGHYARAVMIEVTLTLPTGWQASCALDMTREGDCWRLPPTPVDVLVDSPVLAGRHHRRIELDPRVHLTLVADRADQLDATPEQIAPHRAVVEQADRLFGARHFDRFEMLLALSDELSAAGVEHHRSFEGVTTADYLTDWTANMPRRDTVPHEYVHSWNGKHRRGANSWQPCFEKPIRNSLMWVYEGLTQYWTDVLCARSGLWRLDETLGAIARTAALYDVRPGSRWRPTIDTTRDPIIAARTPLPWPSWQRSEDYYGEGSLIWLDVDTLIREASDDRTSLDDWARAFFGQDAGSWATRLYDFDEVVDTLRAVAARDWRGFFEQRLDRTRDGAPLAGLARGGYRLVYRDEPSSFQRVYDAGSGQIDLTHSLGLTLATDGAITDVLWDGPAFAAGLTIGGKVTAVGEHGFAPDALLHAIRTAGNQPITFQVTTGKQARNVAIACPDGLRYPHLEPIAGARRRLEEILRPREA